MLYLSQTFQTSRFHRNTPTHGLTALPLNLTVNKKALKLPNNSRRYEGISVREICAHNSRIHLNLFVGRIQNMDLGPWTTRWTRSMDHSMDPVHGPSPRTTPNFEKEIVPVNMKIYWRSGYEKHILIFIAYFLEDLSRNSGLL